jgi:hypothetical protein
MLELKKKKGKLLPSQKEFNDIFDEKYKTVNFQRAVAYGFTEAKTIIGEWAWKSIEY